MDIVLGVLVKPLGLQGELKLWESEDFWEAALGSERLDVVRGPERRRVRVARARVYSAGVQALCFDGVTERRAAERLVGHALAVEADGLDVPLPEKPRAFQLRGLEVRLPDGSVLGHVEEILHLPAQDVFVVGDGARQFMVPDAPAFVRELDLPGRVLRIEPIPGLLEL